MVIDPDSSTPVFQQICDSIVADILGGQIVPGSHLPPVRHLAADLKVAANTVAKAYKQLGEEGHVRSQGRNGTLVLALAGTADLSSVAVTNFVQTARDQGLSLNEAIGLVRRSW